MLTRDETRRLTQDMERELGTDVGALVKCAAGLIAVVCIALFAAAPAEEPSPAAAAATTVQTAGNADR